MTDIELLLYTLIERCEQLYVEKIALETLLIGANAPGWQKMRERLLSEETELRQRIHASFQPLYDLAKREAQAGRALQELLRVLPKPEQWS